jgi:hypothetical protein
LLYGIISWRPIKFFEPGFSTQAYGIAGNVICTFGGTQTGDKARRVAVAGTFVHFLSPGFYRWLGP